MDYKHGIYGETSSAVGIADVSQGTVPIYIGTLPVHRMDLTKTAKVKFVESVNCIMILLNSLNDIKALNLYSEDWEAYSLCEPMNVHFVNGDVGPIILIGNKEVDLASTTTTTDVPLTKSGTSYIGYLDDSRVDISDLALTVDTNTLESADFSYEYEGDKIKIVIKKAGFTATTVKASYKKVQPAKLTATEFKEALDLAERAEHITRRIPNIICAPQYSNIPEYHDLMVQMAIDRLSGKWGTICLSDIINDEIVSKETAIAWKNTNSYNNKYDKVFYPKLAYAGKVYHMSTIAAATMQSIDIENDGIPYVSVSNKQVFADSVVDDSGNAVYLSEREANELNENGITTAIIMKGHIRLWGSHMANYNFEKLSEITPEDRFDVAIRMSVYLQNYLQYNYLDEVDKTITRKDIDSIANSVQMWLDSLVNSGMLLYAEVEFDGDSDVANGDIVFNIHVTYPFIAKSITFKVIYTDKGLGTLTMSEEGGDE